MHKLLISLLTIALLIPMAAYAQGGPAGGPTPPTGGGTCDWTEYKDSIKSTESKGYWDFNGNAGGGNTANGMYQFIEPTAYGLEAYKQAKQNPALPAGCLILGQGQYTGFNRDECAPLQEAMMDEFTHNNLITLQNNCPAVVQAAASGSSPYVPCPVTWSGILAGAHLGGAGSVARNNGVCGLLTSGKDPCDNLGTCLSDYVCKHGGKQVPAADCSPADYDYIPGSPADGWEGDIPLPGRLGEDFLKAYWVGGLQLMTNQLTSVMMMQVQAIGKFFDVKHQLETQRIMQTKYAKAHKDYHPSEQMCEIGTFSRDLLNSEQRAKLTHTAITEKMMSRGLGSGDGITTTGNDSDKKSRLKQFIDTFCSTEDNARNNDLLCDGTIGGPDQQNIDIDFTRLIDTPLTLAIDLTATAATPGSPTADELIEEKTETNIFAFLNYIFLHDTLPTTGRAKTTLEKFVIPYQDARSLMAMRSVAHNSFAALIAMKTAGPKIPPSGTGTESASPYLKALMREMGMDDNEIENFIGTNPSYYAQMEILTKKMYQNPEFVTNLYDKPANVRRIRAAMTAIKLMQDRDIHEALMRREMLISMILELKLRKKQHKLTDEINNMIGVPRINGKFVTDY